MACKVTVGDPQQIFQCIKIQEFIHDKGRHDPHTDLVLKCFVELCQQLLHLLLFPLHNNTVYDVQDAKAAQPEKKPKIGKKRTQETQHDHAKAQ